MAVSVFVVLYLTDIQLNTDSSVVGFITLLGQLGAGTVFGYSLLVVTVITIIIFDL